MSTGRHLPEISNFHNTRFKSGALNHFLVIDLQNCSERLWTSSEVFVKRRIGSCRLRKSWYSPVKNLMPLTQKKLAGII